MTEPNQPSGESSVTIAENVEHYADLLIKEVRKQSRNDCAANNAHRAIDEGLMRVGVPNIMPSYISGIGGWSIGGFNGVGDVNGVGDDNGDSDGEIKHDAGSFDGGSLPTMETDHDDDDDDDDDNEGSGDDVVLQTINFMLAATNYVLRRLNHAIQVGQQREALEARDDLEHENLEATDGDDEGSA